MLRATAVGAAALLGLLSAVPAAKADIDLEWRPLEQAVNPGDPLGIGIWAVSDSDEDQYFSAAQAIITWDPDYLELTGNFDDWWTSGFIPGDSFGFNEASPPADGDGMWTGMLQPGTELPATPDGTLLTTITFEALAPTPGTYVEILESLQLPDHPMGFTKIICGTTNVLGEIGPPAMVEIVLESMDFYPMHLAGYMTVKLNPEPTSLSLLLLGGLALIRLRRPA